MDRNMKATSELQNRWIWRPKLIGLPLRTMINASTKLEASAQEKLSSILQPPITTLRRRMEKPPTNTVSSCLDIRRSKPWRINSGLTEGVPMDLPRKTGIRPLNDFAREPAQRARYSLRWSYRREPHQRFPGTLSSTD